MFRHDSTIKGFVKTHVQIHQGKGVHKMIILVNGDM